VLLSIIAPVRNEIEYISRTFNSICEATVDIECEIFFVDGNSDDGTYEWLNSALIGIENCSLISNSKKYVNFGFNIAFPMTSGKYISRLDGHTIYPKNYFKTSIDILDNNEADIVGGPAMHRGRTWRGETIAKCMMHYFGVGNSSFRISDNRMLVDTIPFAVYKRKVFEDVGLYDEELIKNQDDEHNYRCRSFGYRIMMDPKLKTDYFVKETLIDLWSQYFRYGLYKPLVFKKTPSGKRLHHIIPSLFMISGILTILLSLFKSFFLLPIILYSCLLIIISIMIQPTIKRKFYSVLVFPCLHIAYGAGYIFGLLKNTK